MKKTGAILKKAREEKGLSLHEIGLSLKINSKILKSIEDGDSTQSPAKTFLRGFVQSYASYLRLDVDEVMAVFYEEMGSTRPKPLLREEYVAAAQAENIEEGKAPVAEAASSSADAGLAKKDSTHHLHQKNHTKTIIISAIVVVLIGLIFFTKKMIDKYSKEAQVEGIEVKTPISAQTEDPAAPATTVVGTEPATPPAATPANPSAPMSVAPTTAVNPITPPVAAPSAPVESAKKPVTPTPAPTPPTETKPATPPPAAAPITAPAASPTATPAPETPAAAEAAKPPAATGKPIELIIEALDNVEIEYSSNTGKKSTLKLAAEQVHTFKSKNGLKLTISNGGAVNIILNGRDMSIPGDLGKPITLSY